MSTTFYEAGGNAEIEVRVDHDLCSGSGYCVRLSPDVFAFRGEKSWVRGNVDWASQRRERLEAAAEACPWRAITVKYVHGGDENNNAYRSNA